MKGNVEALRRRYEELTARLSDGDVFKDQKRYRGLAREHRYIEKQLAVGERWLDLQEQVEGSREILKTEKDPELLEMAREELAEL